jgi:hypothetical protein
VGHASSQGDEETPGKNFRILLRQVTELSTREIENVIELNLDHRLAVSKAEALDRNKHGQAH